MNTYDVTIRTRDDQSFVFRDISEKDIYSNGECYYVLVRETNECCSFPFCNILYTRLKLVEGDFPDDPWN